MNRPTRLLLIALFLPFPAGAALADGKVFAGADWSTLRERREDEQVAIIRCKDGIAHMLLAIRFEAGVDEHAVWIVPVRGTPAEARVALRDKFPHFIGKSPRAQANRARDSAIVTLAVWPLACVCPLWLPTLASKDVDGVRTFDYAEQFGLRSEVIHAASLEALAEYLQQQQLSISADALASFAPYVNDEHALVVTRVLSPERLRAEFPDLDRYPHDKRAPCLELWFRSPAPWFPLRATCSEQLGTTAIRVYVDGCHTLPGETLVRLDGEVRHYHLTHLGLFGENVSERPIDERFYTRFRAEPSLSSLTEDLQFAAIDSRPLERIARNGEPLARLVGVGGILLLPYLAGGIAGLLAVRRWRRPSAVGATMTLTLPVMLYFLYRTRLRPEPVLEDDAQRPAGPRTRFPPDPDRMKFLLWFVAVYYAEVVLVALLWRPW